MSTIPTPCDEDDYKDEEVVWIFIRYNLPHWPAQINLSAVNSLNSTTTKGLRMIPVITFNDPDTSVVRIHKKRKKRQERLLKRNRILKWNAIDEYQHILKDYTYRMKVDSIDDIYDIIFHQWNDVALLQAEKELERIANVERLNIQRHLEYEKLSKAYDEAQQNFNADSGKIYDGRVWNKKTKTWIGWELHVGDKILYYPEFGIRKGNKPITTTIIKLRDRYESLRLSGCAPVGVECDLAPPFWDTEIQKLPGDDKNPIFYPLSQCKFYPGEMENKFDQKHIEIRTKFNKEMKSAGWGNMMHKSGLSTGDVDTESDIVVHILENNNDKGKKGKSLDTAESK
eukprot:266316_1